MKKLIAKQIQLNKALWHKWSPHVKDVFWTNPQDNVPFFGKGVPDYGFSNKWEAMEVGYDFETDITLRIQIADWPGIPTIGAKVMFSDATWKVRAQDRTSDGSEVMLLVVRGE